MNIPDVPALMPCNRPEPVYLHLGHTSKLICANCRWELVEVRYYGSAIPDYLHSAPMPPVVYAAPRTTGPSEHKGDATP